MTPAEQASREQLLASQLKELSGRDTQLWLIGFLVLLVMASGVIALVLPNLFDSIGTLRAEGRYLPQLLLGLIAIVVLFNAYLLEQRRALNMARQELVRQALLYQQSEQLALLDPLTHSFNRRYLEQVLPKEVSRAKRQDTPLTLMVVDLDGFTQINDQLGHVAGDQLLVEAAQLLQRTLRTSDIVVRYGGDEFMVVMPDTGEAHAQYALERLLNEVIVWNAEAKRAARLSLSCGVAQYQPGETAEAAIQRADQRMYAHKSRHQRRTPAPASPGALEVAT